MRRFAYLLGVWLIAVLVTATGCNISGQPCGWLNLSACDQPPQLPMCDARVFQPFAIVYLPMVEPGRRIPLRSAVDIALRVG